MGNAHVNIVPSQDFPTADGGMIIAVGNDALCASLCAVLGAPGGATDAGFATNPQQVSHRDERVALIGLRARKVL